MTIPRYDNWHEAFADFAQQVRDRATQPEHEAFAALLDRANVAVHHLGTVWSGECKPGFELPAIKAAIGHKPHV